ncbi:sulfatase-like hydrolase/transferase [Roseibium aggregatum]|nr:sulfatase-like hydrolase/transferase [Roseibium aggregatum]
MTCTTSMAQESKPPNILVIWGDDVGWQNVSAYGMGTMGYTTPNIDRLANEGLRFTDHYAQPSCTAGRAAFLTGQYPIRSGMTTVGQPGSPLGLKAESPTLAEELKQIGYRTGHFGKNHLGDRNEHLPTVHGFDDTEQPRFGVIGKQTVEDTGPLTQERMKNFDEGEVIPLAKNFMKNAQEAGEPFFVWLNTSRMNLYTRLNDEWRYAAETYTTEADYHGSGMLQHDHDIGLVLDWLDQQGLTENTIVWYSTDNGPEHSSWPHGATTPFRGEKMTTYEGGVRVISMVRWPNILEAGKTLTGIQAHQDMFTTLAAAAGIEDVKAEVMAEKQQFIDGVNNLAYWKGEQAKSNRNHIFHYYESVLTAIRMGPWKFHFSTKEDYYANLVPRTAPLVFNIRADPFESYDSTDGYGHLMQKVSWLIQPMGVLMGQHLQSLADYPPVQGGASFNMSNIVEDFLSKGMQ